MLNSHVADLNLSHTSLTQLRQSHIAVLLRATHTGYTVHTHTCTLHYVFLLTGVRFTYHVRTLYSLPPFFPCTATAELVPIRVQEFKCEFCDSFPRSRWTVDKSGTSSIFKSRAEIALHQRKENSRFNMRTVPTAVQRCAKRR